MEEILPINESLAVEDILLVEQKTPSSASFTLDIRRDESLASTLTKVQKVL
jgi:hypothetical protein